MRKKGHLSLVETPVTQSNQMLSEVSSANLKPLKAKHTVPQRLKDVEVELASIRDITDAASSLVRSLPMGLLNANELSDLHQMFRHGESLLDLYETELAHLSKERLSTQEIRQFTRARNILRHLRTSLPEATDCISLVIRNTLKKKTTRSGSKAETPARGKVVALVAPNGIQLKVTLKGSKPPVWRRLLVPGNCTLGELHFIIQRSMGWSDSHLHCFYINEKNFCELRDDYNENEHTLQEFNLKKGSKFEYEYDLGDSWVHTVLVEKILDEPQDLLECIDGRNACPAED